MSPESIYGLLADWGERLIRDEDFEELYSHTGRPSISPALLAKVQLLMYNDNVSDREAEERAKYDLRWKAPLGLSLQESGFDYTALSRFRARLLVNQKQKLVFERFVRLAAEIGIIKGNGIQIIDSTNILGAGAVKDTFNLIKTAIQKNVVSTQDIKEDEDGQVELKKGVARDRIISVEDPEMRHGHKTSSGMFNGHKAQIISDAESEIITNVSLTPGNSHDSQAVKDLINEAILKPGCNNYRSLPMFPFHQIRNFACYGNRHS